MAYFPTFLEWLQFVGAMEDKGFRKPTADERAKYARGYGLIPPESRAYQERGEISLLYEPPRKKNVAPKLQNDYRVIVWTTKRDGGWVSVDSAWVLIVNGAGFRVHTSRPIIRKGPKFPWTLNINSHQNVRGARASIPDFLCEGIIASLRRIHI